MTEYRIKVAKIKFRVYTAIFVACLALGLFLIISTTIEARQREVEWQRSEINMWASAARDLFEQNREHFDVLTQGGLIEQRVFVEGRGSLYEGWNLTLHYRENGRMEEVRMHVSYELDYIVSDTLEWLSTEEILALYHLFSNLPLRFIDSRGSSWIYEITRGVGTGGDQHLSFGLNDHLFYRFFPELFPEGSPWLLPLRIEYSPAMTEESSFERRRLDRSNVYSLDYIHHLDDAYFFHTGTGMAGPNARQIRLGVFILIVGSCFGIGSLVNLNRIREIKKLDEQTSQVVQNGCRAR